MSQPCPDPPHAHLWEQTLRSEQVYRGHFLDVRRDHVQLPDGGTATREYIVHPGAVMVVPLLDDGRLVMERQWRYPLARAMLEFPAGKLEPGEPPLTCGIRELAEETGYRATEWARAGNHAQRHRVLERRHRNLVRARPDAGASASSTPASSSMWSLPLPKSLKPWPGSGELTDAKTLIGLLWLQNWRAGRWALAWQDAARFRQTLIIGS